MLFPDNKERKYQCFVCGVVFNNYNEMKDHVIEVHEEGREYLVCPVKFCGAPVRDLRFHFRNKHPACKCPEDRQLRATIMYDIKGPNKRKKLPNFENGFHVSTKTGKKMHFRSGYERDVYECLDKLGDVLRYEVEPFSVPYFYKGKKKQYFPDLLVEFSSGAIEIWEIKPSNQTVLEQNKAKWEAAKYYCKLRGWVFEPITEQRISQLKKLSQG
jgi:rubredoxin